MPSLTLKESTSLAANKTLVARCLRTNQETKTFQELKKILVAKDFEPNDIIYCINLLLRYHKSILINETIIHVLLEL